VPQLAQGVHLLPLDALRTLSLSRLHSLDREKVFISFSPQDARGRRGLLNVAGASDRQKTMRTFNFN